MPEALHVGSGKVRELYALDDDRLLLVASDRLSTYDVVLPTEIPDKGRVLSGLSAYWFTRTRDVVPNHFLALRPDGRSIECVRLTMLPVEFVVRGFLAGSGWVDYRETGEVCGHRLPAGLARVRTAADADRDPGDEVGRRTRPQHLGGRGCRALRGGALRGGARGGPRALRDSRPSTRRRAASSSRTRSSSSAWIATGR